MPLTESSRLPLVAHPDFGNPAVRAIEGGVVRAAGVLSVVWVLEGELERLRIPAWRGCSGGERLWEHTCFEVFVSRPGAARYHELNFAPSGAWAVYDFERYRTRAPLADAPVDPGIVVQRGESSCELEATLRLERLSPQYAHAPLALALSAVIEDREGGLSYWGLAHPSGKPDFHHRDSFALAVPGEGVRHSRLARE